MSESSANATASGKRLRILFLSPFAPSLQARHSGARVIAKLICHLGQRYAVGLCYLRSTNEPSVDDALKERCEVIEEVVLPHTDASGKKRWSRRRRIWKQVLAGKPLWAIARFSPAYSERLRNLLTSWKPDIVQLEFHIMGQYLPALEDYPARRILVDHEPGVESAREAIGSCITKGKLMPVLDLMAWRRFEPEVVRQVDTVVVFTDSDRAAIRSLGENTPMVQIAPGTEIPECTSNTPAQGAPSLLFTGNFRRPLNIDAADRLINNIFPEVQSIFSDARLFIVGDHSPAHLLQNGNPNVFVTGSMCDTVPYLEQASLVVIPLRRGGGMRLKTLEALAAGKSIVASARAVEGLGVINGQHLILAESDEEFVGAIVDLMHNPEKRLALSSQARDWACANLSWERAAAEYEKLYRCLLRC